MRELTFQEKITLKGILSEMGVPANYIVRLNMSTALFYWSQHFRGSIADYPIIQIKYKGWAQRRRMHLWSGGWA